MILELLVSILTIGPVAPPAAPTPDLKCPPTHSMPGTPLTSVVVLVDGKIEAVAVPGESTNRVDELIDAESIHGIAIKCWNPDTDELPAPEGMPLILITSKAYAEVQRAAVEEAVAAVLAFEEAHGRAPTGLDEVEMLGRSVDATVGSSASATEGRGAVAYGVSDHGWWIGNAGGPLAYRCSAEKSATTDPEVACEPSYELAKENLRARYERGERGGQT